MRLDRLLCIHSLTAHGVVGLKAFLPVLGEFCLPVPSRLLTGPGNMPGCTHHGYDFPAMLRGTLGALVTRNERCGLVIGYLADATQIDAILAIIPEFREVISGIAVDPVSGDGGRAYVAASLIAAWPRLLEIADIAFPNQTEAELLTSARGDDAPAALRRQFPKTTFVITGRRHENSIESLLVASDATDSHRQPRRSGHWSGTGDLFAASFLRAHWIERVSKVAALRIAAEAVDQAIAIAVARGSDELSFA